VSFDIKVGAFMYLFDLQQLESGGVTLPCMWCCHGSECVVEHIMKFETIVLW
jgi:hypothetical protein